MEDLECPDLLCRGRMREGIYRDAIGGHANVGICYRCEDCGEVLIDFQQAIDFVDSFKKICYEGLHNNVILRMPSLFDGGAEDPTFTDPDSSYSA